MDRNEKLLRTIVARRADAGIPFADLRRLLLRLGFEERVHGDHRIFSREDVEEIVNLQPKGGKAKRYQVKQVRNLILRYGLSLGDER